MDANILTLFVITSIMKKIIPNYENLPEVNKRIYDLIQKESDGVISRFAELIGVSQQVVDRLFKPDARSGKYPKVSEGIKEALNGVFGFTEIWYLPESEINVSFSTKREEIYEPKKLVPATSKKGVPYFDETECTGSILSMYNDRPERPSFYINYEHFNDCTAYIPVAGDSMYPKYCSGEIVAVKQIHNKEILLWGEVYLVVTNENANDMRTIKEVHPHEDASKLVLRASNPNYRGDTVINKNDIISIFIVKGKIKRNQL